MRVCPARDKILAYRAAHPGATIREIQRACEISSTSVVQHHLKAAMYGKYDRVALEMENAELRRRVNELTRQLFRVP